MKNNSKLNTILLIILIILALGIIWILWHDRKAEEGKDSFVKNQQNYQTNDTKLVEKSTKAGFRFYQNDLIGFSFMYPEKYGDVKGKGETLNDYGTKNLVRFGENGTSMYIDGSLLPEVISDSGNGWFQFVSMTSDFSEKGLGDALRNENEYNSKVKNGVLMKTTTGHDFVYIDNLEKINPQLGSLALHMAIFKIPNPKNNFKYVTFSSSYQITHKDFFDVVKSVQFN